jgi:uncharacterized protein (DUF362 family)
MEADMKKSSGMSRREFLKQTAAFGAVAGGSLLLASLGLSAKKEDAHEVAASQQGVTAKQTDIVAVKNGEPAAMIDAALASLGGMGMFVKKGQTVVVKPNIGWNRAPEDGANTHPSLVRRVIEHCFDAGASKVYVFDHTCDNWEFTYKTSGIEAAAKEAGAVVVPAHAQRYYHEVQNPGAQKIKKLKVHELILDTDVFINIPVLKHHSGAGVTIAMKNLMGVVWDRGAYHSKGLSTCIADFCLFKTPDLNIVDAYRVMMNRGPRGGRGAKLALQKSLLVSRDIVAVDAAAAKIFGVEPEKVPYILRGHMNKTGNMNLEELSIKKISL